MRAKHSNQVLQHVRVMCMPKHKPAPHAATCYLPYHDIAVFMGGNKIKVHSLARSTLRKPCSKRTRESPPRARIGGCEAHRRRSNEAKAAPFCDSTKHIAMQYRDMWRVLCYVALLSTSLMRSEEGAKEGPITSHVKTKWSLRLQMYTGGQ
jgi:hypothetical protein